MARSLIPPNSEAIAPHLGVVTVCACFLKKLNKYQEFDVFPDVSNVVCRPFMAGCAGSIEPTHST
jgi:hypothetical protein